MEQQIPWRTLASGDTTQCNWKSQVPSSEIPEVVKDKSSSHNEQAVLSSSAEIFLDTLACLTLQF